MKKIINIKKNLLIFRINITINYNKLIIKYLYITGNDIYRMIILLHA